MSTAVVHKIRVLVSLVITSLVHHAQFLCDISYAMVSEDRECYIYSCVSIRTRLDV